MPTPASAYQTLLTLYNKLPWYKKAGFWLSAPKLAWGLFGYKQSPNKNGVKQIIQWAKASWVFKTKVEHDIYNVVNPAVNLNSNYTKPPPNTNSVALGGCADVIGVIAEYGVGQAYAATSRFHRNADTTRKLQITNQLLLAVAYGMESKEANVPVKASSAGNLFKSNLYAKELLQKSPEFLLERGNVTDWAGRTFKSITAFEYALWAKDFKMIEMMLKCIPATPEGDEIRAALFEQAKQVKAPIEAGGGLTYKHTYDRPNLDAAGIPDGRITSVTEVHTENHFDVTPLCASYLDYDANFNARTRRQRDAYWTKLIGKLQRLLPVHILQRYCDPNTSFYLPSQFIGEFKRSTDFYNNITRFGAAIFGSSLSSDFALIRGVDRGAQRYGEERYGAGAPCAGFSNGPVQIDLVAVRQLDKVSTNKIEKIIRQLSQPRHSAWPRP